MEWKLLQESIFTQSQFKFVTSFNSITVSRTLKPQEHMQFFFCFQIPQMLYLSGVGALTLLEQNRKHLRKPRKALMLVEHLLIANNICPCHRHRRIRTFNNCIIVSVSTEQMTNDQKNVTMASCCLQKPLPHRRHDIHLTILI